MFEPVKDKKFDVILFNTPYLPTEEEDIIDSDLNYAFDGGSDGRKIIDRFLNEVKNHLNEGGCVQIIQSSLSNTEQTLVKLDQLGFIAEVAKSEKFVKDIQRALIQSDVNIQLVLKLSKKIEDRALNEEPPKGITPREHVIRIIQPDWIH